MWRLIRICWALASEGTFSDVAAQWKGRVPVSILHKSIAGRYRPVRVADGPTTARC